MKGQYLWLVVHLVTALGLVAALLLAQAVEQGGATHRALCEAVAELGRCELKSSPVRKSVPYPVLQYRE